jgi:thiol-disulfide isomerase/thioredoxin
MNAKAQFRAVIVLALSLGLAAAAGLAAQSRQQAPPEYKDLVAAYDLKDPALRLKEFERIMASYPNSQYREAIDAGILQAKVELTGTLEAVLALQKEFLNGAQGPARLQRPVVMAVQLLNHTRLASFSPSEVLAAVVKYKEMALKAAEESATYEGIPQDQRSFFKSQFSNALELLMARAYMNVGDAVKAAEALDGYKRSGGATGSNYSYVQAGIFELTNKIPEAFDAYLAAAVDHYEDAAEKAKALYIKLHGRPDGFEAALEAKSKAVPFRPEPFKGPADWKGKAVLAELFTGSECPPCVAADLAFDGLAETFPPQYLAVLVYHLPIPRPDPMMNPATKERQGVYGVNSTPTVVIDGAEKSLGGGARGAAEGKFAQYRSSIEPLLSAAPGVSLKAHATLLADSVKVVYDFDKTVPGAVYLLVLVQNEQEHPGGNGIVYHKMVVRDLLPVNPALPRSAAFDLAASEKATDAYLTEFEKTYTRTPNFKWDVRRAAIARKGLKVVFFVQDTTTGKVLNAVVADVK